MKNAAEKVLDAMLAGEFLAALTDRQYDVVALLYGFQTGKQMTETEVAGELGISQPAVHSLHARALAAMQENAQDWYGGVRPSVEDYVTPALAGLRVA